jgi:protein subunit release factor A
MTDAPTAALGGAKPFAIDRASLERDTKIELFVAGGPGGQHRNKTESGVRLTHGPSGVVVIATERRSQHQNREVAFERLAERLARLLRPRTPRKDTKVPKSQKRRRLADKRARGEKKASRRRPDRDGD